MKRGRAARFVVRNKRLGFSRLEVNSKLFASLVSGVSFDRKRFGLSGVRSTVLNL